MVDTPLVLRGRGNRLVVDPPVLLAPLEGVTDAAFLAGVLPLGGLGAACVPFVRLSGSAFGPAALRRRWDHGTCPVPVGLQLLAQDTVGLTATATHAEALGVPFLDLNFGCPSPTVLQSGGGAALLDHPERIAGITAAAVAATDLPVTVKLRAGGDDDARLEELLDAAAGAGAAGIVLHARLRREGYEVPARWERLARAVAFLARRHPDVPLVGNGGIKRPEDAVRMRTGTGCAAVMPATGMMADPWLVARMAGAPGPAGPAAVVAWLTAYAGRVRSAAGERAALGRLKQLLAQIDVPEWPVGPQRRAAWLRAETLDGLLATMADRQDG